MAFTKLYLTNLAAPSTPATLRGSWDDTSAVVTKALDATKVGGGNVTAITRAETNAGANFDVLLYRGVSGKLAAQTIAGNLDVVIGVGELLGAADFAYHLHVYVTQGDSDTPRGTLLNNYVETTGNEWSASTAGKALSSAQAMSSLAISAGDRIVVEIGYVALNAVTTSYTGELLYGTLDAFTGAVAVDATAGAGMGTLTNFRAGFITFSNAISEASPVTVRLSQSAIEVWESIPVPLRISQSQIEVWSTVPPSGGGTITGGVSPTQGVVPVAPKWFVHIILPSGTERWYAETDLCDPVSWYGGYKAGLLVNISDVERELTVGYRKSTWSFELVDVDLVGEWHTIADTETVEGATVTLYGVDDNVREAGGVPFRAATGEVQTHETGDGIRYKFSVEDAAGLRLMNVGSDPKVPNHPLLKSDFAGLDPAAEGKFAPIAIGKLITGTGALPGIYMGYINLLDALGGSAANVVVDIYLMSEYAVKQVTQYYHTLPTWGSEEAISGGWLARPTSGNATGYYYVATNSGTTGTSEPNGPGASSGPYWPTVIGDTVTDGSVTWRCQALDNPDLRFPIPASAWGTVAAASFMPGWFAATGLNTDYIDGFVGRRYGIVVFIARSFSLAKALREKRIIITADAYGVTPNADGSGNYIDSPEMALAFILTQIVFNDSYGTTYYPVPTINGYDMIDMASITAAEAVAAADLTGGFKVGFMLGRGGGQQSGFSIMQELCEGGDFEAGPNWHGQLMVGKEDPAAAAVLTVDDFSDIVRMAITTEASTNVNWMQYRYGFRYTPEISLAGTPKEGQPLPPTATARTAPWASGALTKEDTVAQTKIKKIKRQNFDNYVTVDAPTGERVATRKFKRFIGPAPTTDGRKVFTIEGGLSLLGSGSTVLDLNSVIGISSELGLGAGGYTGKTGRIRKIRLSPSTMKVTLSGSVLHPYT